MDAVAPLGPNNVVFTCLSSSLCSSDFMFLSRLSIPRCTYSRGTLFDICNTFFCKLNPAHAKELHNLSLLRRPALTSTPTTAAHTQRKHGRQCKRRQKQGKHRGIRARLVANPHKLLYRLSYSPMYAPWTTNWTTYTFCTLS